MSRQMGLFTDEGVSHTQVKLLPDCEHARAGKIPRRGKMIISASKRTDIPAFYLPWFIKQIKVGWVDVPNPMYRNAPDPLKALTHVSLLPSDVLAIVWWSKNYGVYERFSTTFNAFDNQYFHFTINPRRPDLAFIEPDVPSVEEALRQVRFLASLPGGPDMVAWRYDPLLFWTDRTTRELRSSWDPIFFEYMCQHLTSVGVTKCFTSFADHFAKFRKRVRDFFPDFELRFQTEGETFDIVGTMHRIASKYGMFVFACTENAMVARGVVTAPAPRIDRAGPPSGFEHSGGFVNSSGSCIDGRQFVQRSFAKATDSAMKGREDCACSKHLDIGDYVSQECGYGCLYCYANPNHRKFRSLPI